MNLKLKAIRIKGYYYKPYFMEFDIPLESEASGDADFLARLLEVGGHEIEFARILSVHEVYQLPDGFERRTVKRELKRPKVVVIKYGERHELFTEKEYWDLHGKGTYPIKYMRFFAYAVMVKLLYNRRGYDFDPSTKDDKLRYDPWRANISGMKNFLELWDWCEAHRAVIESSMSRAEYEYEDSYGDSRLLDLRALYESLVDGVTDPTPPPVVLDERHATSIRCMDILNWGTDERLNLQLHRSMTDPLPATVPYRQYRTEMVGVPTLDRHFFISRANMKLFLHEYGHSEPKMSETLQPTGTLYEIDEETFMSLADRLGCSDFHSQASIVYKAAKKGFVIWKP